MVEQLLPNTNENATVYFDTPKFGSKHSLSCGKFLGSVTVVLFVLFGNLCPIMD
jgi:hypothetical protein